MERTEKPSSHLLDLNPKSHGEPDVLFKLKVLAKMAEQMDPSDTKQTSEPRRPHLVSRNIRPISVTRMVKENWGSNPTLDTNKNSEEAVAAAQILVEWLNEKNETCIRIFPARQEQGGSQSGCKEERKYAVILEPTERNVDEPKQLNDKKCISETAAQCSSRKRKLRSGELQAKARKRMQGEPHVCEICGKSFATGVQLGGHKRAHCKKAAESSVKCWSIRKCVDSKLVFYLTIRKNQKCVSSNGSDL